MINNKPAASSKLPRSRSQAPRKSKSKTKPGSNDVVVSAIPLDAPVWMQRTLVELTRHDLGPRFREAVQELAELEQAYQFAGGGKLPLEGRPEQFVGWFWDGQKWVGKHEAIRFQHRIPEFAASFQRWWGSMQPAWRLKDGSGNWVRVVSEGQSWNPLVQPGKDGLLLVVAALNWWGREEAGSPSAS
uniref:Uncharacterized protein n=1 Tax=Mycena chlorophos TaxID=658473 RepID=A0ABQ0L0M1_MYCCL|nr:predicted protein [Mycena chlorophos]